jgi:hypothetical protein
LRCPCTQILVYRATSCWRRSFRPGGLASPNNCSRRSAWLMPDFRAYPTATRRLSTTCERPLPREIALVDDRSGVSPPGGRGLGPDRLLAIRPEAPRRGSLHRFMRTVRLPRPRRRYRRCSSYAATSATSGPCPLAPCLWMPQTVALSEERATVIRSCGSFDHDDLDAVASVVGAPRGLPPLQLHCSSMIVRISPLDMSTGSAFDRIVSHEAAT